MRREALNYFPRTIDGESDATLMRNQVFLGTERRLVGVDPRDRVLVIRVHCFLKRRNHGFHDAAFRADVNGSSALIEEPSQKHAELLPALALRACVA